MSIEQTVENYVKGFLTRDTELLRQTFAADAQLMTADEGGIAAVHTRDWFTALDNRKAEGVPVPDVKSELVGMLETGNAAVAHVRLVFPSHQYDDYLALVKTKDGWRIVSKIYNLQ